CAVPAAVCAALGCAARVTRQERNASNSNYCCRACPGVLPEEADSRECFARNAERAGRLSRKGVRHRMSPSAERALLPTSRGNNNERALVPTALLISPDIRRLAAQRSFAQPTACLHVPTK